MQLYPHVASTLQELNSFSQLQDTYWSYTHKKKASNLELQPLPGLRGKPARMKEPCSMS